jgi:5'-deoxynucleotidase YfbR-like HD superfamily hydrolase
MDLEQIKQKKSELDNEVKEFFNSFMKQIFEENPEILLVSWTQYTPYFNDGDPCVFRVNEPCIAVEKHESEEQADDSYEEFIEYEDYVYPIFSRWDSEDDHEKYEDLLGKIEEILSEVESYLQNIFSDHSRVIAFKDKVVVEEYDHG